MKSIKDNNTNINIHNMISKGSNTDNFSSSKNIVYLFNINVMTKAKSTK